MAEITVNRNNIGLMILSTVVERPRKVGHVWLHFFSHSLRLC